MATILELKDIEKSYGEQKILNQVSFSVEEGEVLVILGPSGCGKSTLLRCINGLEPIQAGRVELEGKEILKSSSCSPKNRHGISILRPFPTLNSSKKSFISTSKGSKKVSRGSEGRGIKTT